MRKISGWLIAMVVLISGCTFNVDIMTPVPIGTPITVTAPSQNTPIATALSPTVVPSSTATFVPARTDPFFMNARTSSSPDDLNQHSSFAAGTREVYAIWDYQNMREGLVVRREWYWNDQLWLMREEPWDFKKYGANGTIRDISIYDNETGLNTGTYQLRLYINNVLQPIGSDIYSPLYPWITFSVGLDGLTSAAASPDSQWAVEIYNEKRIVLKNSSTDVSTEIYTGREIAYMSWFGDSQHFLFVDRDRSVQKPDSNIVAHDDLWLVEVPGGATHLIYRSDIPFAGYAGPMPSLDGRYIASLQGSGYGDACIVDKSLIFFELAGDFRGATPIKQQDFSGLPAFNEGWVYPMDDGGWQDGNVYRVTLDGTCNADKSKLGLFLFHVPDRTAAQASAVARAGDLGWGSVHGRITDVATGAPLANALVTCEHHSYTSTALCSGTVLTNANGEYVFNNVFFHDTDSIQVTVQATGYDTVGIGSNTFTVNDMQADVALYKAQ